MIFTGGPVVAFDTEALGVGRFILIGTVHGAFEECSNDIPGIFVETDDLTVLEFLQKEAIDAWSRSFEPAFFVKEQK